MAQHTDNPNSVKANRTMRLVRAPHATEPGKLTITETKGRKTTTTDYTVELADSQIGGRAFLVHKLDETGEVVERYSVLVNGTDSRCDCAWGCYGANEKACRHVAALTVLLATGKLDAPVMTCR